MGAHARRREPKPGEGWRYAGMVVAGLIALAGLVFIGALIFTVIAFNGYGSNK
jgi:hypothetical protein